MATIQFNILNQLQTPAFYASSLATRPAFGFAGRIFIDSDSPSTGIYRDTGSAWVQVGPVGSGAAGNLQTVTNNGNTTTLGLNVGGRLNLSGATDNVNYQLNLVGNIFASGSISTNTIIAPGGALTLTGTFAAGKGRFQANSVIPSGAITDYTLASSAGLYGIYMGVATSGTSWLQSGREDNATTYPLIINPTGGYVQTGSRLNINNATDNASYALSVQGNALFLGGVNGADGSFTNSIGIGGGVVGQLSLIGATSDQWATSGASALTLNGNNTISTITTFQDNSAIRIGAGITEKTGIFISGTTAAGGSYVSVNTGNAEQLKIIASGSYFTGTLGINGVADSVKGGIYTPTLTTISTVLTSVNVGIHKYQRIGNIVTVFGFLGFNQPLGYNQSQYTLTLPITQTNTGLSGQGVVTGTIFSSTLDNRGEIFQTATNSIYLNISTNSVGPSSGNIFYSFSYEIA